MERAGMPIPQDLHKIYTRFAQDLHKICTRFAQDLHEIRNVKLDL